MLYAVVTAKLNSFKTTTVLYRSALTLPLCCHAVTESHMYSTILFDSACLLVLKTVLPNILEYAHRLM